jgi:hypothetical protein
LQRLPDQIQADVGRLPQFTVDDPPGNRGGHSHGLRFPVTLPRLPRFSDSLNRLV